MMGLLTQAVGLGWGSAGLRPAPCPEVRVERGVDTVAFATLRSQLWLPPRADSPGGRGAKGGGPSAQANGLGTRHHPKTVRPFGPHLWVLVPTSPRTAE